MAKCDHLDQVIHNVQPIGTTCKECAAVGQRPVQLRICLTCGNVGCCDSTPGRHATKHFKETGHPVMKAFKSGDWKWCYIHQSYV